MRQDCSLVKVRTCTEYACGEMRRVFCGRLAAALFLCDALRVWCTRMSVATSLDEMPIHVSERRAGRVVTASFSCRHVCS